MADATITVRDIKNGRIAVKLTLNPKETPASPAHQVAASFLAWLAQSQKTQAATSGTTERKS